MRGYTRRKANIYDNGNNNSESERFARSIILQIPSQRFLEKRVFAAKRITQRSVSLTIFKFKEKKCRKNTFDHSKSINDEIVIFCYLRTKRFISLKLLVRD